MSSSRLPALAVALALAAGLLLTACGSSSKTTPTTPTPTGAAAQSCGNTIFKGTSRLRVAGVGCTTGLAVVAAWSSNGACQAGTSRPSCAVFRGYRCIAARTAAGLAVTCSAPRRSVSFIAKPR